MQYPTIATGVIYDPGQSGTLNLVWFLTRYIDDVEYELYDPRYRRLIYHYMNDYYTNNNKIHVLDTLL